jgi:hypothetical protein
MARAANGVESIEWCLSPPCAAPPCTSDLLVTPNRSASAPPPSTPWLPKTDHQTFCTLTLLVLTGANSEGARVRAETTLDGKGLTLGWRTRLQRRLPSLGHL